MLTRRNVLSRLPLVAFGSTQWGCELVPTRELGSMRKRIESDIKAWDAIEDHRTGTQGDTLTAQWLAHEITATGLDPHLDSFAFQRRVLHECWVSVGTQRAEGVPLFDGAYTSAEVQRGPLCSISEGSKQEDSPQKYLCQAPGGIGVTRFEPTGQEATTAALQIARRNRQYKAIVAIASSDGIEPGLTLLNADAYLQPFGPPVVQVATEHALWLEEAAAAGADADFVAHMSLQPTQATNVQTKIVGADASLRPLVVMTPRSAWWTSTSERAGGIALWLAIMRYFAQHRPARTVIFTANTGHELGHIGLDHYLTSESALIKGAHAWIHLGANFAATGGAVLFQASTQQMMAQSLVEFTNNGETPDYIMPVNDRPFGEARNIYDGGGQYVSILGDNRLFHHPSDRWPGAVDLDQTTRLTHIMLAIARNLSEV